MDSKWAYGFEDGMEIGGDYSFLLADSEYQAKQLAKDAAIEFFENTGEAVSMVVWEMVPRVRGISLITEGEDLGDGDAEPDEFDTVDWHELRRP